MKNDDRKDDVSVYRVGRMTILQIMGLLAALGLIATWALHSFFGS
jgi:hypothetical protein